MRKKDASSADDPMLSYLLRTEDIWLWIDSAIYGSATSDDEKSPHSAPQELPLPKKNPHEYASLIAVTLRSQERFCMRSKGKTFAYDTDLQAITAYPVILASTLHYAENVTKVERRSPYPPPEHGTAAVILRQTYHISDLPEQAQQRQKHISQMLEELPTQPTETPDSFVYPLCPQELQNMIQQLAQDYYQHHQTTGQTSRKRAIPHTPNLFESGFADTAVCLPIQAVIAGIQNAKSAFARWEQPQDHGVNPFYRTPCEGDISDRWFVR